MSCQAAAEIQRTIAAQGFEHLYERERARADEMTQEVQGKAREVDEIVGLHGEYIASAEELQEQ